MKPFCCRHCQAILGYTDGNKFTIPHAYLDRAQPTVNLVTLRAQVLLECGCGYTRKWYPLQVYPKDRVEQKVLTPA